MLTIKTPITVSVAEDQTLTGRPEVVEDDVTVAEAFRPVPSVRDGSRSPGGIEVGCHRSHNDNRARRVRFDVPAGAKTPSARDRRDRSRLRSGGSPPLRHSYDTRSSRLIRTRVDDNEALRSQAPPAHRHGYDTRSSRDARR